MKKLVLLLGAFTWTVKGFNVFGDLYSRPKYDVVFSPKNIIETDIPSTPTEGIKIMNLGGRKYLCHIPADNFTDPNNAPVSTEIDFVKAKSRALELLGSELTSATSHECIYYSTGYWTYEVCFDRGVRQFHPKGIVMTGDGVPEPVDPSQTYTLGRFVPSTQLMVRSNGEVAYVSQTLYGGTVCDLTGEERAIEIKYYCKPEIEDEMISNIKEIRTCNYELTIYTPKLCQDVAFIPPKESISNEITCQKIVSEDEERTFQAIEQAKEERQEREDQEKEENQPAGTEGDMDDSVSFIPPPGAKTTYVPKVPPEIDYENRIIRVDLPPSEDISTEIENAISSLTSPIIEDLHEGRVVIDGHTMSPSEDFEFEMTLLDFDDIPVIDLNIVTDDGLLYIEVFEPDPEDMELELPEIAVTSGSHDHESTQTAPPSPAYTLTQTEMTKPVIHDEL